MRGVGTRRGTFALGAPPQSPNGVEGAAGFGGVINGKASLAMRPSVDAVRQGGEGGGGGGGEGIRTRANLATVRARPLWDVSANSWRCGRKERRAGGRARGGRSHPLAHVWRLVFDAIWPSDGRESVSGRGGGLARFLLACFPARRPPISDDSAVWRARERRFRAPRSSARPPEPGALGTSRPPGRRCKSRGLPSPPAVRWPNLCSLCVGHFFFPPWRWEGGGKKMPKTKYCKGPGKKRRKKKERGGRCNKMGDRHNAVPRTRRTRRWGEKVDSLDNIN